MFIIDRSISEGNFVISAPNKTDQVFKVELDDNEISGFKGLPQEFMHLISSFTKEEINENPHAIL
jgi:hypothetical protein